MVNLYTILWTSAPETILESETLDQACPPPPFIRQKSDILEVVWLMMPTVRGSGGSTMDWSCFAHSEPGQLDVINETMNFAVWLKSSRHHFVPSSSNALDSGFKSIWDVIVGPYAGNSCFKKKKQNCNMTELKQNSSTMKQKSSIISVKGGTTTFLLRGKLLFVIFFFSSLK